MKKRVALWVIVILCLSGVGVCGFMPIVTAEADGGGNQNIYSAVNVSLVGLVHGETWNLTDGVEIWAENGQNLLLGTLNEADLTIIIEDPSITFGSFVTADNTVTEFLLKSEVISFAPSNKPSAYASDSISLGSGDADSKKSVVMLMSAF